MPNFIVSYVLKEQKPDLHSQFKIDAMDEGFSDRIKIDTGDKGWEILLLPPTTIWGKFNDENEASKVLRRVVAKDSKYILEKFYISDRGGLILSDKRWSSSKPQNELSECIAHQRANP